MVAFCKKPPPANGDPAIGVRAPVVELIVKAEMSAEDLLTIYTYFPRGSVITSTGTLPAEYGEPGTAVSAPVLRSMLKQETSLEPLLAAYKNLPPGLTATANGCVPAVNGE